MDQASLLRSFELEFRVAKNPALFESLLHRIFTLSSEIISITTFEEGLCLYANDAFFEVVGFRREDIIGRTFDLWANPSDRKELVLMLKERGTVRNFESDFLDEAGNIHHALLNLQCVEILGVQCILTVARDITKDRVQMKESLHIELLDDLRQALKSLPNLVFRLEKDENGMLVYTLSEGKIAEAMGLTTEAIYGRTVPELFPPEIYAVAEPHIRRALNGEHTEFEIEVGGVVLHKLMSPYYENDRIKGVVGAAIDITEKRKLETLLQRSEMSSVLGQLAAGAAHEIRNPLTAIKGFVQLAGELFDRSGNAKGREYIDMAMAELSRVNGLVTEMLWLRKPKEIRYEPVSVPKLLQEMVPLLHVEANIKSIQVLLHMEDVPDIMAKSDLLKQVVLNLCKNGIEAMNEGGSLHLSSWSAGGKVFVGIRDTGPGIPAELQGQLFTPFLTTKPTGNGLGLFICKQIVQDMNGDIQIESSPQGTAATLSFPAAPA
ncbi:PAS domain S-box protein [Paenibacillus antri]|uniref:histidine kinase n=1 Tax=Paenibacillus antri TaxID=2582848 RepID=A0A5R9GLX8_9BACL|nr:PAS domain S-box protein [Paenibacillus antri]